MNFECILNEKRLAKIRWNLGLEKNVLCQLLQVKQNLQIQRANHKQHVDGLYR